MDEYSRWDLAVAKSEPAQGCHLQLLGNVKTMWQKCYLEQINISRNLGQWHATNIDNCAGTHGQKNNQDLTPQVKTD